MFCLSHNDCHNYNYTIIHFVFVPKSDLSYSGYEKVVTSGQYIILQ